MENAEHLFKNKIILCFPWVPSSVFIGVRTGSFWVFQQTGEGGGHCEGTIRQNGVSRGTRVFIKAHVVSTFPRESGYTAGSTFLFSEIIGKFPECTTIIMFVCTFVNENKFRWQKYWHFHTHFHKLGGGISRDSEHPKSKETDKWWSPMHSE